MMTVKAMVYLIVSGIGATILALLGGWDVALKTLVIFMAIDFITGLFVAGFKLSPKTETGGLSSKVSFLGLCRKFTVLLFIFMATALDTILKTAFVRDAVIIGFIVNESLSIVENAGLMGLPLPAVIIQAIELLKKKADQKEVDNND